MPDHPLRFNDLDEAIRALAERLTVVDIEPSLGACAGRVLAESIVADRDSPAADVSAMDGYAIRLSDISSERAIPVLGECTPGTPPPAMLPGAAVRIFTGAVLPNEAEAVIKREDTDEVGDTIRIRPSAMATRLGEHIRRSGENAKAGTTVLRSGQCLSAAQRALIANFGYRKVDVHSPVRVSIITTGNEVGFFLKTSPEPWQLFNSNWYSLSSLLEPHPWIHVVHQDHCHDDRGALTTLMRERVAVSDAIMVTGGVSMGDYDHVPDCCRDVGGEVVFHGLPIRPGKPILGAATSEGKLILGLPGNPVSATVCGRRFALPLLAKKSGQQDWLPRVPVVTVEEFGSKILPLHWFRLVRMRHHGVAEIVESQGSGDLVSLGASDGFIECAPQENGPGPWPYFAW